MKIEKRKYSKNKKVKLSSKEKRALRVFNERVFTVLKTIYRSKTPIFVEDIYELTGITKPTIYYCIRVLKEQGLLDYSAQSRFRSYTVADKKKAIVKRMLSLVRVI